jgi:uncharacterized protein YbjT (DUF2867 family)
MKTALLAGSTGLVGSELLRILTGHQEYEKIHILVRKPSGIQSQKIHEHVIHFDELESFVPGGPVHHIFCTLGTTIKKAGTKENFRKVDHDYVLALGRLAKTLNTEKFLVVTALGANARSAIFYNRVKGEVEEALARLDPDHLFIFRPSLLMGNRQEQRAGEKTAIAVYSVINPLFIGRLKKYKGIQAGQVAQAMVNVALDHDEKLKIFESNEIQDL